MRTINHKMNSDLNRSDIPLINKVAEVTFLFWLLKIVATTLGETLGDFIAQTLNLGYLTGIAITGVGFLIVLAVQLRLKKFIPVVFWLVIIGTTTFGTEISDAVDRAMHLRQCINRFTLPLNTLWILLYCDVTSFKKVQTHCCYGLHANSCVEFHILSTRSTG